MKILLDGKFVMDMETLEKITEVERIGDYNNHKYSVVCELSSSIDVVRDIDIVWGEEADKVKGEDNGKNLAIKEKALAEAKLELARLKAFNRILEEKKGLSKEQIKDYVESTEYIWTLNDATSEDVRKYLKSRPTEEGTK